MKAANTATAISLVVTLASLYGAYLERDKAALNLEMAKVWRTEDGRTTAKKEGLEKLVGHLAGDGRCDAH